MSERTQEVAPGAGTDVQDEAGFEPGVETSVETGVEAGVEAGVDAGVDEGTPPVDREVVDRAAGDEPTAEGGGSGRVQRLEREGDIAADYLEELLDIADLDGDIDMDVEGDRAAVSIVGDDVADLVGEGGAVLEALQELTRLAVLRETGERSRLMLDVGGFRAKRREELVELGSRTASEVLASGTPVALPPMTPFERKVVHDAVAEAGARSSSDGEEPDRHVVVSPA